MVAGGLLGGLGEGPSKVGRAGMPRVVGPREFEEVWTKLKSRGWELQKHGEQRRSHYLLPINQKCKPSCRVGSYISQLTATDGSSRAVYRTRGEVMHHIGKGTGPAKKTAGAIQKKAAPKTTFVLKKPAQSSRKAKSPAVSPALEPDSGPIPMSAKPAAQPSPAACPVCLTEFCTMSPTTKVFQLEHCDHFVCYSCLDQECGVCPTPECGQRFVSTRRSRKLTAEHVVPAPLPGSPSKPTPKLKQPQSRTWEDVSITWRSCLYLATVTELGHSTFLVHYPGINKKYDEILSREALQLRAPDWTRCDQRSFLVVTFEPPIRCCAPAVSTAQNISRPDPMRARFDVCIARQRLTIQNSDKP